MPSLNYRRPSRQRFSLLKPFYQIPGVVKMILKRQQHYVGLSLLALINIILAVGLVTNASFFTQAVDRVVLLQELEKFSSVTGRPPFSTQIYVFPSRRQPVPLEQAEQIGRSVSQTLAGEVGLPVRQLVTQISSGSMMLQPAPGSDLLAQGKEYMGNVEVIYIDGVAEQMMIVDGQPIDSTEAPGDVLIVWVHDAMAQSMGLNVGDELSMGPNLIDTQRRVRVAGIWKPVDEKAEFWFSNPNSAFKTAFLVQRDAYIRLVQTLIPSGSAEASWYVVLDESELVPKNSAGYLAGFQRADDLINKYLSGARMNMPPLDPLADFVQRSNTMTIMLLGYNLPAFGILLYFLALTSAIMAAWQRRETVMLVSRGMSAGGVLSLTLVEQILLFLIGYPLGILFGMFIAWVMGYTASFLTFTSRPALPVSMEGFSLPLTLLALTFALISRLWPAMKAARASLVTDERERARPMHKPFWYRLYLDILLLVPTFYAYDQMVKRGSLAGLVTDRPEDLYRDPLLVVVPALFVLTASLVTMRVFAMLMKVVDLIAGRVPWLTMHLALRQLGRQSLDYVQPLLLVIISLAMGVYTLSMAASLDQWTMDRMYYANGADVTISPEPSIEGAEVIDGSWIPLPQDFTKVQGIEAVTRVGDFDMRVTPVGSSEIRGRFLAIDRVEFPSAAWFRPDFANESLGAMMNRLAPLPDGILVSQAFLEEHNLRAGDRLEVMVSIEGLMTVWSEYTIVGTFNYFPTVYEERVAFVGNLEYLNTLTGLTVNHDIWMRTATGTDVKKMGQDIVNQLHIFPGSLRDSRGMVAEEQGRMERVGIFGTLSVGFLATALMAILGLLVYSYASLQERAYRLAVLNAVGLSRNQILMQVVFEYAFLALFGAVAGALIGMFASQLFVPFFRFTGEQGIPLPPLIPIIASDKLRMLSLAFGGTIVGLEVAVIASILHNRLAQILKRVWI